MDVRHWITQRLFFNGWYGVAVFGIALTYAAGTFVAIKSVNNLLPVIIAGYVVQMIAILPLTVLWWRHRRRRGAFIRSHDYRLCTKCVYVLDKELQGRPCPECGEVADFDHCRETWMRVTKHWPR
jgi:uncharacterized paraquat-inducible protein A